MRLWHVDRQINLRTYFERFETSELKIIHSAVHSHNFFLEFGRGGRKTCVEMPQQFAHC